MLQGPGSLLSAPASLEPALPTATRATVSGGQAGGAAPFWEPLLFSTTTLKAGTS
jgi:hypothetical protein